VVYGTTPAYGSQQGSSAFVTLHRITLSGLRLSTGYHFKVLSEDVNNTSAASADNTFLTPAATTTTTVQKAPASSAPLTKITIRHTETIPPTIQLSKISGAYKHAPLLTGSADDNAGIAAVEYSLDGGVNWLPVDSLAGAGAKHVTYSFTPVVPQDGNYEMVARATDTSGNKTSTSVQTLIIDRLPPLVGGNILSVGPQLIEPDSDGTIRAQQGVDQTITMSAIGGATSITLEAVAGVAPAAGSRQYSESFNLTYSTDTGLWSGVASFGRPGRYSLTAIALDGAGNKTTRQLNAVNVSPPGHILSSNSRKALDAQVNVYYLEPETNAWVVWDAAAYGQQNPQHTRKDGSFMLYLPAGKYYLKAKAHGYHDYVSSIFTLKRVTPVTANLLLKPMRGPSIAGHYLSFPNLSTDRLPFTDQEQSQISHNDLIGKAAPDFALLNSSGDTVHFAQLLGRPTVLVMDSLWSPTGTEQLSALTKLQANQDINIYPVALQEGLGKVQASMAIAGSSLTWLVDPDSNLTSSYGVKSLPTIYFLDRSGIVRYVETGPLNPTQIMEIVSRL